MKAYWDNGPVQLYQADARSIPLPDQSVHCVVTSPPYFGLRVYKDNDDRGIGLESTVEDYIGNLVDVFREVRRVLRDDGALWLNLGDSYGDGGDRLGIPERVVMALQADGWIWRDTVIWAKKSAMPESVAGWRWERCRVKVGNEGRGGEAWRDGPNGDAIQQGHAKDGSFAQDAQWEDCPGCPKCADNDGLVLRKSSWRTTQAHEYIYMLTKGMGYYADGEAVKTANIDPYDNRKGRNHNGNKQPSGTLAYIRAGDAIYPSANRRSVWNDISPEPYGGSHFATFPSDLPRICIQASTSERGCCSECGSQWARVVEREKHPTRDMEAQRAATAIATGRDDRHVSGPEKMLDTTTSTGWRPTCNHTAPAIPATVLDPFSGTATTCAAAQRLGRRAVGVDISEAYLDQAVRRLSAVTLPMGI